MAAAFAVDMACFDERLATMMMIIPFPFLKEASVGTRQKEQNAQQLFHSILMGMELSINNRNEESKCPATGDEGRSLRKGYSPEAPGGDSDCASGVRE